MNIHSNKASTTSSNMVDLLRYKIVNQELVKSNVKLKKQLYASAKINFLCKIKYFQVLEKLKSFRVMVQKSLDESESEERERVFCNKVGNSSHVRLPTINEEGEDEGDDIPTTFQGQDDNCVLLKMENFDNSDEEDCIEPQPAPRSSLGDHSIEMPNLPVEEKFDVSTPSTSKDLFSAKDDNQNFPEEVLVAPISTAPKSAESLVVRISLNSILQNTKAEIQLRKTNKNMRREKFWKFLKSRSAMFPKIEPLPQNPQQRCKKRRLSLENQEKPSAKIALRRASNLN